MNISRNVLYASCSYEKEHPDEHSLRILQYPCGGLLHLVEDPLQGPHLGVFRVQGPAPETTNTWARGEKRGRGRGEI